MRSLFISAAILCWPLRIAARPGIRVPGSWDGFELAVRAILGQQVTVQGATTLAGRLVRSFGRPIENESPLTHLFPSPDTLADADLRQIGLPGARAQCIRTLARAVCDGKISFSGMVNVPDFLQQFRELPGIGEWTAQYVAMRALGEPDAFPASDLGLLQPALCPVPASCWLGRKRGDRGAPTPPCICGKLRPIPPVLRFSPKKTPWQKLKNIGLGMRRLSPPFPEKERA